MSFYYLPFCLLYFWPHILILLYHLLLLKHFSDKFHRNRVYHFLFLLRIEKDIKKKREIESSCYVGWREIFLWLCIIKNTFMNAFKILEFFSSSLFLHLLLKPQCRKKKFKLLDSFFPTLFHLISLSIFSIACKSYYVLWKKGEKIIQADHCNAVQGTFQLGFLFFSFSLKEKKEKNDFYDFIWKTHS